MSEDKRNTTITVRDLQRNAAAALKRLERGDTITVTRLGRTVARTLPPDPAEEAINQAVEDGVIDRADLARARTAAETAKIRRAPALPDGDVAGQSLQDLRDLEGDR
ncbi:type II toxin-antitoxin system Phd/YefM family antitoxin [Streptomyces sp. NPDC060223]|uniref:type II toxin-antitoxin system Phd/YefM family antitoxin n=1 Tax=unclassified Streptomyces TaxID=2593676 RepID=UPI003625101B